MSRTYIVPEVYMVRNPAQQLPSSEGLFWSAASVHSDPGGFVESTTALRITIIVYNNPMLCQAKRCRYTWQRLAFSENSLDRTHLHDTISVVGPMGHLRQVLESWTYPGHTLQNNPNNTQQNSSFVWGELQLVGTYTNTASKGLLTGIQCNSRSLTTIACNCIPGFAKSEARMGYGEWSREWDPACVFQRQHTSTSKVKRFLAGAACCPNWLGCGRWRQPSEVNTSI